MSAILDLYDGESGTVLCRAPWDLIDGMSSPGQKDDDVQFALESGRVEWTASADDIRRFCKSTGAWDDEQLADDDENRARAFWVLACNADEDPEVYGYSPEGGAS